jgi:hypothetical protein
MDEDENLVEAGSLGRGKPIPVFFETLEHRVEHPERGLFRKCQKGGPQSGANRTRAGPTGGLGFLKDRRVEEERRAVIVRESSQSSSGERAGDKTAARFKAWEGKASERKKPMSAGEAVTSGEIQRRRTQASEG